MATKQSKKALRALHPHVHTKHLRYSRKAGLLLLALLVVLLGFMTYSHKRAVDKTATIQQAQFDKVDAQMKTVMAQIEATAGKPYELHHDYGCSYARIKFGTGPLGCSIHYSFSYQINSVAEGKALISTVTAPMRAISEQYYTVPSDISNVKDVFEYNYDVSSSPQSCALKYQAESKEFYNSKSGTVYHQDVKSNFVATFTFDCYGRAVRALYPVEKSS